jgi:hypothetical protein
MAWPQLADERAEEADRADGRGGQVLTHHKAFPHVMLKLVSASIKPTALNEKWTLKQVQGDEWLSGIGRHT